MFLINANDVLKGDEKIAKVLIDNGANVNLENGDKDYPIHIAAKIGKLSIQFSSIKRLAHHFNMIRSRWADRFAS